MLWLLQAAAVDVQPAAPVTVVGWPGAVTTILIALIGALPSALTSIAAAWKTIKSNTQVEKKVAETDNKVAEAQKKVEEATVKIDSAAVEREKNKGEITQQIQIQQQATEQLMPQVIQEVHNRIERHKEANRRQYEQLKRDNAEQLAQLQNEYRAKIKRLEEAVVQAEKDKHS